MNLLSLISENNGWIYIIVGVVIVVGVVVTILLINKNKKKKETTIIESKEPKEESEVTHDVTPPKEEVTLVQNEVSEENKVEPIEEEKEAPLDTNLLDEAPKKEDTTLSDEPKEEESDEDETSEIVVRKDENGAISFFSYNRSFTAKLIQSPILVQDRYTIIKNTLLSYKGVKSRVSWSYDAFHKGRVSLALILIKGKTLNLYLSLNPKDYENTKYHFDDVSMVKKYQDTPLRLRLRNDLNVRYAMELIDILMKNNDLIKGEPLENDYHLPFEETNALIEKKLIKLVKSDNPDFNKEEKPREDEVQKELDKETLPLKKEISLDNIQSLERKEVEATEVNNIVSDKDALDSIIVEKHRQEFTKKGIINVDTLNDNFNDGDTVTIQSLHEKGLLNPKYNSVKVLSRGRISKKLKVIANDFSVESIKMIILTGGTVVKIEKE